MFIIRYQSIFLSLAGLFMALSLGAFLVFGLVVGIDFKGGTLIELSFVDGRPPQTVLEDALAPLALGGYSLRPTDDANYLLRTRELSDDDRTRVLEALSLNDTVTFEVVRLNTVGPTLGVELRNKAAVALALVLVLIICYVAFTFRSVSRPVSSWKYGVIAIIALFHDIIIPVGVFSLLGVVAGIEIDALFVMALLAILGYSVNDTIVIFDRIRENLKKNAEQKRVEAFPDLVGRSLEETFARSLNTSATTLVVLIALFFFGGEPTRFFALALSLGVIAGSYSSLFLAAPLLVLAERYQEPVNDSDTTRKPSGA